MDAFDGVFFVGVAFVRAAFDGGEGSRSELVDVPANFNSEKEANER